MNEILTAAPIELANKRPASPKPVENMPTANDSRSVRQTQALQNLARILLDLRITDFRQVCADWHADSNAIDTSAHDVQELLVAWATRVLGEDKPSGSSAA